MGRPTGTIVIACAPGDALTGARLAKAVGEAGHDCALHQRGPNLKADKALFDAADPLVLVWSRHAAVDAGLLREASSAAASGALVLARLDAVRPPPALRGSHSVTISLARPQRGIVALLALLAAPPASRTTRSGSTRPKGPTQKGKVPMNPTIDETTGRDERSTWRGTLLLTVMLIGVAWSAYYVAFGKPPLDVMALIAGLKA
jgi:hypothetical protein